MHGWRFCGEQVLGRGDVLASHMESSTVKKHLSAMRHRDWSVVSLNTFLLKAYPLIRPSNERLIIITAQFQQWNRLQFWAIIGHSWEENFCEFMPVFVFYNCSKLSTISFLKMWYYNSLPLNTQYLGLAWKRWLESIATNKAKILVHWDDTDSLYWKPEYGIKQIF